MHLDETDDFVLCCKYVGQRLSLLSLLFFFLSCLLSFSSTRSSLPISSLLLPFHLSAFLSSIYLPAPTLHTPHIYTDVTKRPSASMCVCKCKCVSQDSVTAWVVWLFLLWINEHKGWCPSRPLGICVCMCICFLLDWTPQTSISNIFPVNSAVVRSAIVFFLVCVRPYMFVSVSGLDSRVTSDLCGLRPVAVIHAGAGGKSRRVVTIWINMSAVHSCSLSLSLSLSFLPSLLPHPTFSLSVAIFPFLSPTYSLVWILSFSFYFFFLSTLPPSPFIFQLLPFICKSLPSLLSLFPPFTYLSSVPTSLPTFLSHGHLPFCKSIFLALNHCLHHLSPSSISFSLSSEPVSVFPPRSLSLFQRQDSISVHYQSIIAPPTKRHILLFSLS